jgi:hypothetical protein
LWCLVKKTLVTIAYAPYSNQLRYINPIGWFASYVAIRVREVDYRMSGNFHGVLIFVIFVVDFQSRKFPPPKIVDYRYVSIDKGRGQKHRGSTATRSLC